MLTVPKMARPITYRRDAVQSAGNARAIIVRKRTDAGDREMEILATHGSIEEVDGLLAVACFRRSPQVKHDFDQLLQLWSVRQGFVHRQWQDIEQSVEIVNTLPLFWGRREVDRGVRHSTPTTLSAICLPKRCQQQRCWADTLLRCRRSVSA